MRAIVLHEFGPAENLRYEEALAWAASGRLVPAVQAFALKDAAAAHNALESRATVGKVVLVP